MEATDSAPALSPPGRFRFLKRRRFWLLAGALLLVAVVGSTRLQAPLFLTRLKTENFEQIQPGMAQEEVEALLGGPPGYYRHSPSFRVFDVRPSHYHPDPSRARGELWFGDGQCIAVTFDTTGNVSYKFQWLKPLPASKD
jgi:hypothetical protein